MQDFFTLINLQQKFGITVRVWREYIKSGRLKASKIGRAYFVSTENLDSFMKSNVVSNQKVKSDDSQKYDFSNLSDDPLENDRDNDQEWQSPLFTSYRWARLEAVAERLKHDERL